MTLLAMWLGEECVALATDSRMVDLIDGEYETISDTVPKLHRLTSGNTMFAIGFGEGASDWLSSCQCPVHRNYPEHWCGCSQARTIDELEEFIKGDLQATSFGPEHLKLYVAGVNKRGGLEAFILNGAGQRTKELTVGGVVFSPPVLRGHIGGERGGLPVSKNLTRWFEVIKGQIERDDGKLAGARALEETGKQALAWCGQYGPSYIGGCLRYEVI